jgi:hypothetical protein
VKAPDVLSYVAVDDVYQSPEVWSNAFQGKDPPGLPQLDEALAVNVSESIVLERSLIPLDGNLVAELAR